MKLQKIIFIVSVLFSLLHITFSQDTSNSNLFASIFPANCEFVNQHVDFLIDELEKHPSSKGFIVINWQQSKTDKLSRIGFIYEDIMSLEIKRRNFDTNRLKIIRSNKDKLKLDFYLVPNEKDKPDFYETVWDLSIPSKPIIFDDGLGGQLCSETLYQLNTFAELLNSNPKAKGKFVVRATKKVDFQKEVKVLLDEIRKVGIDVNRIRFVYIKDNSIIYPDSRLWLLPKAN